VRVLLDEQLPRRLVRELVGHDVSTAQKQGWSGVKNGGLELAADHGFSKRPIKVCRFSRTWRERA